jgi:hypothetical protein
MVERRRNIYLIGRGWRPLAYKVEPGANGVAPWDGGNERGRSGVVNSKWVDLGAANAGKWQMAVEWI